MSFWQPKRSTSQIHLHALRFATRWRLAKSISVSKSVARLRKELGILKATTSACKHAIKLSRVVPTNVTTSVTWDIANRAEFTQESLCSVHAGLPRWIHQLSVGRFNQLVMDRAKRLYHADIHALSNVILAIAHHVLNSFLSHASVGRRIIRRCTVIKRIQIAESNVVSHWNADICVKRFAIPRANASILLRN